MKNKGSDNSSAHPAAQYDAQIRNTIPYYDCFHEETIKLIKAMKIQPNVWIDTGCGTGRLVEKAALQFPKTRFVLADPSEEMIKQAKKRLSFCLKGRAEFLECCGTMGLRKEKGLKADVVTAIQSHHYMSEKERAEATKACHKILEQGGVYVTFENIRPFTRRGTKIGKEYWKGFQIASGKGKDAAEKHIKRFGVEYFPITVEEHLALLRGAGFETVELFWYSYMQAGFYCIK